MIFFLGGLDDSKCDKNIMFNKINIHTIQPDVDFSYALKAELYDEMFLYIWYNDGDSVSLQQRQQKSQTLQHWWMQQFLFRFCMYAWLCDSLTFLDLQLKIHKQRKQKHHHSHGWSYAHQVPSVNVSKSDTFDNCKRFGASICGLSAILGNLY